MPRPLVPLHTHRPHLRRQKPRPCRGNESLDDDIRFGLWVARNDDVETCPVGGFGIVDDQRTRVDQQAPQRGLESIVGTDERKSSPLQHRTATDQPVDHLAIGAEVGVGIDVVQSVIGRQRHPRRLIGVEHLDPAMIDVEAAVAEQANEDGRRNAQTFRWPRNEDPKVGTAMDSWRGGGGRVRCSAFANQETSVMAKRRRIGKLSWRSKKANHGRKPGRGKDKKMR